MAILVSFNLYGIPFAVSAISHIMNTRYVVQLLLVYLMGYCGSNQLLKLPNAYMRLSSLPKLGINLSYWKQSKLLRYYSIQRLTA